MPRQILLRGVYEQEQAGRGQATPHRSEDGRTEQLQRYPAGESDEDAELIS